ncbi:hypothetical protein MASSI9I_90491 [Massilia sp. 9I]|nr:hypothetical protein MASSI9I_90491 [Massilia sp. 9I]
MAPRRSPPSTRPRSRTHARCSRTASPARLRAPDAPRRLQASQEGRGLLAFCDRASPSKGNRTPKPEKTLFRLNVTLQWLMPFFQTLADHAWHMSRSERRRLR